MRNPTEIIKALPKEAWECLSFIGAVLFGSIYKMIKQNEKGSKITVRKMLAEAVTSLFIAAVVYASLDQFLHFNKFFTYMMCSLAGSMSSPLHDRFERLINVVFNAAEKAIKMKAKTQVLVYLFAFLGIIVAMNVAVSCAVKPMASTDNTTVSDTKASHTADTNTNTNQAINDKTNWHLPPVKTADENCDSVCSVFVNNLLEQWNVEKQSGDNSYSLLYDRYTRTLTLMAKMAATKNKTIRVTDTLLKTKTVNITKTIPVKYIPDFWEYSAYFGWACAAYFLIRIYLKVSKLWLPKTSIT